MIAMIVGISCGLLFGARSPDLLKLLLLLWRNGEREKGGEAREGREGRKGRGSPNEIFNGVRACLEEGRQR